MDERQKRLSRTKEELSLNERRLLLALKDERSLRPEKAMRKGGFSQEVEVMNAASWLRSKGLLDVQEEVHHRVSLGRKTYAALGLPERRALEVLGKNEGVASLKELEDAGKLTAEEVNISIGWLNRKRWAKVRKDGGETYLVMTETGKAALGKPGPDEEIVQLLSRKDMAAEDIPKEVLKDLKGRKDVIIEKEDVDRRLELTEDGRYVLESGIEIKREVTQLTSDLLRSGKWRDVEFRRYDIESFAPTPWGGRMHPLSRIIERIRRIFLDMGFSEIAGNSMELELWNMDALFIPQDHPARDLQDTFYMDTPDPLGALQFNERKDIDPFELFSKVHENGGDTGSTGWGYEWSRERSLRPILRTHTTVNTIRYLYDHPEPPLKVFSVEKVFRNEAIDARHLPEFHQIEGILVEEGASLNMLIGLLKEFYSKMGFDEIKVQPSYYPYTEPSLDVVVNWHGKWMELGGAGIFRPEVSLPAGVKEPVLAWGLGLERLAMMVLGSKDIRDLYMSDIEWLRNVPFK